VVHKKCIPLDNKNKLFNKF